MIQIMAWNKYDNFPTTQLHILAKINFIILNII
jgi:hypothetical protein